MNRAETREETPSFEVQLDGAFFGRALFEIAFVALSLAGLCAAALAGFAWAEGLGQAWGPSQTAALLLVIVVDQVSLLILMTIGFLLCWTLSVMALPWSHPGKSKARPLPLLARLPARAVGIFVPALWALACAAGAHAKAQPSAGSIALALAAAAAWVCAHGWCVKLIRSSFVGPESARDWKRFRPLACMIAGVACVGWGLSVWKGASAPAEPTAQAAQNLAIAEALDLAGERRREQRSLEKDLEARWIAQTKDSSKDERKGSGSTPDEAQRSGEAP